MSELCKSCGNVIVVGCGPTCLVCPHTGRDKAIARLMEANLNAVYDAMAIARVAEAQAWLSAKIRNPGHDRERPDWREIDADDRGRQEVCQTCLGTRQYLARRCPDCSE